MKDSTDKIASWMQQNPGLFGKMVSLSFVVLGILIIIGAFRDWDWLYKPDDSYHNRWTIGQVSRYAGRTTARVIGFIGGLLLIIAGTVWSYKSFTKG